MIIIPIFVRSSDDEYEVVEKECSCLDWQTKWNIIKKNRAVKKDRKLFKYERD